MRLYPCKNMFKNLTIKSRLIFFFCFMTAMLLGTELVALFGMSNTNNSLTTVYDDRILTLQQLMHIESLILKSRLAIRGSLITPIPDVISINIAQLEKNEAEISKIWKAYMAT
jgi:CHASE3 domain sensor protein